MKCKTLLAIFAAVGLLCGLAACSSGEKAEPTKPPVAQATQPPAKPPTPTPKPATPTPKEAKPTAKPAEPTATPVPPSPTLVAEAKPSMLIASPEDTLDSYRMRTTTRLLEGKGLLGEELNTEVEWVREPPARHTVMYGPSGDTATEVITIGDSTWVKVGDTWIKSEGGQGAGGVSPSAAQESLKATLEDILQDMESAMKPAGEDTVNGVRCQRYTVDTEFSISPPIPEDVPEEARQLMPTEMVGHVKGEICVADQWGVPPVIVGSQTTQEITLKYASRDDETMVYEEKRDLYDINKPITIEPPEGAMEMPSLPTPSSGEQPTPLAGQPGATIETASLDSLDSYRLDWSIQMQMSGGGGMNMSYTMEWVREPPARHLVMSLEGSPFGEYTWIGDTVWAKMGDTWIQATGEDAEDVFDQLGDIMEPDSDMVLAGEETVNGIHCKHYVYDLGDTMHKEIWAADQSDLPPVVIRGMFRMETSQMVTEAEGNVYDINTPITIEPPK
jgi:hypothetical protein